jgi:murein DD-endopeptidase MepM/ murein hydrolase activator NlpD
MPTTQHHLNTRGSAARRSRLALLALALALLAAVASIYAVTPSSASTASTTGAAYRWPVKPFGAPHPVRANFGDPRTTFHAPATQRGLMTGHGVFAFHFGIDIAVPDGTAVYAVQSGVASFRGGRNVHVDSGNGLATEYWHIIPTIEAGQQVVAYETVLGHVMKGYEHVHFAEFRNGSAVNPLAPGHLGPYVDRTKPELGEITFRTPRGEDLLPEYVHGSVDLIARASDSPARPVAGIWGDLPVAPALLTWRVERVDGTQAIAERIAFDVREATPDNREFWRYFARGSRQNMCTFNGQRSWRQPGVYLFLLTREPFDTRQLTNGIYRLIVTASDTGGNRSSTEQTLIVRNPHA